MSHWSRLTTSVRDYIRRQVGRLAGSRPSPAPAPAFRKGVNVLLTRTEVIEELQALLGKIERVDHVMPALLEPQRQPARQLGVDQELHAARGRMRWTLESRAAKARQALMSSRSRSG